MSELMLVWLTVPHHRGAGRQGIELDIQFLVRLAGKIGDEKLLGRDLARSLGLTLDDKRKPDHACHHDGRDEGLCRHHDWASFAGQALACIAHPAWPLLARPSSYRRMPVPSLRWRRERKLNLLSPGGDGGLYFAFLPSNRPSPVRPRFRLRPGSMMWEAAAGTVFDLDQICSAARIANYLLIHHRRNFPFDATGG